MSGTLRIAMVLLFAAGCGGPRAGPALAPSTPDPATSGASCGDLQLGYARALQQARRCDPAAADACAAVRPARLEDPCRCAVSVAPASTAELDRLSEAYRASACPRRPLICNRSCLAPELRCVPGSDGVGTCAGG